MQILHGNAILFRKTSKEYRNTMELEPIGYFSGNSKYRFEAPRQSVFGGASGFILLLDDPNLLAACRDLEGVSRIWVIFQFHLNSNWKPFVHPPVAVGRRKVSLFATRSPHRPNPIGLSCVELKSIRGNRLELGECDLLDGTPVLDIKPYLPEIDSFPDSEVPWRDALVPEAWDVSFSETAREKILWIREISGLDLEHFAMVQLGLAPLDKRRKRLTLRPDGNYGIGCRTWQLVFCPEPAFRRLAVVNVESHYRPVELLPGCEDPYSDKDQHREFLQKFPSGK